jgi:hypothetical protein
LTHAVLIDAAAVPNAAAMADPSYAATAPAATVQVAALLPVSTILTLILTSFVYKRVHRHRGDLALNTDDLPHEALKESHLHQPSSFQGETST